MGSVRRVAASVLAFCSAVAACSSGSPSSEREKASETTTDPKGDRAAGDRVDRDSLEQTKQWPRGRVLEIYLESWTTQAHRAEVERRILDVDFTEGIADVGRHHIKALFLEEIRRLNGSEDVDELGLSASTTDFPYGFLVLARRGTDMDRATKWFERLSRVAFVRRANDLSGIWDIDPAADGSVESARFVALCDEFGGDIEWTMRIEAWLMSSATLDDVERLIDTIHSDFAPDSITYWYLGMHRDDVFRRLGAADGLVLEEITGEDYEVVVFDVETRDEFGPDLESVEFARGVEFLNAPWVACFATSTPLDVVA